MKDQNEAVSAGVRVFGSSIVRVAPDSATIAIGVSRIEQEPKKAFASARSASTAVQNFLKAQVIRESGSSRITLSQEFRFIQGEQRFLGYKARIAYTISLRDLDQLENLLTGLISAGANELTSVTFETTRLKEIRADARREAVSAAREKAELYCRAVGVSVGKVIAINDANPDQLTGAREGHMIAGGTTAGDKAIDPAMISIGASVYITFEIVTTQT